MEGTEVVSGSLPCMVFKKNLNLYFHAEGRDKNVSFPLELLSSTA